MTGHKQVSSSLYQQSTETLTSLNVLGFAQKGGTRRQTISAELFKIRKKTVSAERLKLEKEKVKKCFLDLTQHSRLGGQSLTVESAAGKHKLCSGLDKIKK